MIPKSTRAKIAESMTVSRSRFFFMRPIPTAVETLLLK